MLWRCARDCPRAAQNVDFFYPEYFFKGRLASKKQYGEYEEESFYDPDDADDERSC